MRRGGWLVLLVVVGLGGAVTMRLRGDDDLGGPGPATADRVETVAVATTPAPQATAAARAPAPAATIQPPTQGRWIEVDVVHYSVRLMRGSVVLRTIEPVAVGAQIDTGAYESTQTGLFRVYSMTAGLTYDAPYNTFINWWVGFDPEKANGFHTFLLSADGNVADASTGRVSNGCIRTGAAKEIFEFAEIGMPVLVHA